jgi:peptide-methionine (S)-S-oxide reductase
MSVSKPTLFNPFMRRFSLLVLAPAALVYAAIRLVSVSTVATSTAVTSFPDPAIKTISAAPLTQKQTAVFAGGCFWGMEGVFEHLKGVSEVLTGYAGGSAASAHYEDVSTGATHHAESVKITYDPSQITYGQLLKIYFAVAHDPTQLNQQGSDRGTQYRSAIFFANDEQAKVAQTYIDQLNQAKAFNRPIVTQLNPLEQFYVAEDYHQDFIKHNPGNLYVVLHDLPQIAQLQKQFPELYRE